MTTLTLSLVDGADDELNAALALAKLPTDDLTAPGRTFYRLSDGTRTVGFGGYELYGAHALLRSLVISPEARGRGLGRAATTQLLRQAAREGARHVYLLTDSAETFFAAQGFQRLERTAAPEAILTTRQAAHLCPSSAALMMHTIQGEVA